MMNVLCLLCDSSAFLVHTSKHLCWLFCRCNVAVACNGCMSGCSNQLLLLFGLASVLLLGVSCVHVGVELCSQAAVCCVVQPGYSSKGLSKFKLKSERKKLCCNVQQAPTLNTCFLQQKMSAALAPCADCFFPPVADVSKCPMQTTCISMVL